MSRCADRQTDRGTGGRTDMTQLIVAFRNFENAPNEPCTVQITEYCNVT